MKKITLEKGIRMRREEGLEAQPWDTAIYISHRRICLLPRANFPNHELGCHTDYLKNIKLKTNERSLKSFLFSDNFLGAGDTDPTHTALEEHRDTTGRLIMFWISLPNFAIIPKRKWPRLSIFCLHHKECPGLSYRKMKLYLCTSNL